MREAYNRQLSDGYAKIAVAVITQAILGYRRFKPTSKKRTKNGYTTVYTNFRDAERFLFESRPHTDTKYLEVYLSSYNLEINPEYIRRKAKNGKVNASKCLQDNN